MPDSCLDCGRRTDCVFGDLAPEAFATLDGIKVGHTVAVLMLAERAGDHEVLLEARLLALNLERSGSVAG